MDSFTIVAILTYICTPISLFLNVLLILVVSRYSAKYLIPYRHPLSLTAAANVALSVWYMLSQQTFVLRQRILFVFILGPLRFTPQIACYAVELINIALFLFTCHQPLLIFVYRYKIIFSPKVRTPLRIYLVALTTFASYLLVAFLYVFFTRAAITSSDEAKYRRWAKEIRKIPETTYLIHETDASGKALSLILFMFLLTGYVAMYAMHGLISHRLKTSKNAVSHSRTLQMARAIILMATGTCLIGFLPYSVMLLSVVFNVELSMWSIPVFLGSAFMPILAPITIFYKVDAYRSSLRAIIVKFCRRHEVNATKVEQRPAQAWPK
uniref:G protein-coupled receptor n=1 Tax=Haemonchus contortus TaxID=6289 RepID=A0A7I5EBX1_HAECO